MTNLVALNVEEHADLKVNDNVGFDHVANQHVVPVVAHEFVQLATDVPVVFVKHAETGQFQSVAMLGLQPGENLLVKDGKWLGMYIPGIIATFPFRLMPTQHDETQLMLALDTDAKQVGAEGQALFLDGKETDYLTNRKQAITSYFEHSQITQGFVQLLVDLDLLVERNLTVEVNGQQINPNGLFVIDEKKLNELDDEKSLDLKRRGVLHVIYAHLISINQIRRLGKLKSELGESEA